MEVDETTEDNESVSSPLKEKLWQLLAPVVEREGYQIFDLEAPLRPGASLRVYIWKGPATKGSAQSVILDDCARVSKAIDMIEALDTTIEGHYLLEVSSPGVNRKLTRPEHFLTSVGERVKLVSTEGQSLLGLVVKCDDKSIVLHDEKQDAPVEVELTKVRRAKVDFKF